MNPTDPKVLLSLRSQYRRALLHDVLPFWIKHSVDRQCGGYFTCLERDGSVYDTDKFIWLQARQSWTFSKIYNCLEKKPRWLALAGHGIGFLKAHGRDAKGNWHFSLARDGTPLIQPYSIFSDCFAAMAFSQHAKATGDQESRRIADLTYRNILRRRGNPKGKYSKAVPGSRPMISLSVPMILANVTEELEWMLDPAIAKETVDTCITEVFTLFLDPESGLLRENVAPDGGKLDCFEGRLLNPGHAIEAMWFILDIAEKRSDRALIERAVEVMLRTAQRGWDRKFGGFFYFLDTQGHPTQQLEWDQKLWWVHLEALVAFLKAYRLTGRKVCWNWFQKIHNYTWSHFPDPSHGEWYGYLDRRGKPLLSLKGGKWKGCFHLPRALYLCMREFEAQLSL